MSTSDVDFQHRLFSVGEAAAYLRISRTMIFKLLRQRKLTPTKIGTRTLISGAAIDRLLADTAEQMRTS
jgi:excisionase family DNA binding protein